MDSRIVVVLVCMVIAMACNMTLLFIAARSGNRCLPVALIAALYGSLCSLVPAGAYIVHIIGAQP